MENGHEAKRVKMDDGSLFGHLDVYPPDPIFHVKDKYLADKFPNKVNLGIGGTHAARKYIETTGGGALDLARSLGRSPSGLFFLHLHIQPIVRRTVSHGCYP